MSELPEKDTSNTVLSVVFYNKLLWFVSEQSEKKTLVLRPCLRPCNLQCNSTLKRCKFVTNVWYVKNILANCDGNMYLPILHLPRVELHCKLHEKLHCVTRPSVVLFIQTKKVSSFAADQRMY